LSCSDLKPWKKLKKNVSTFLKWCVIYSNVKWITQYTMHFMYFNTLAVPIKYPFSSGNRREKADVNKNVPCSRWILMSAFLTSHRTIIFHASYYKLITILCSGQEIFFLSFVYFHINMLYYYYNGSVWYMELVININFCFLIRGPWTHIIMKAKDPNLIAIKTLKNCIFILCNWTNM